MNKQLTIATTTINRPTLATRKFAEITETLPNTCLVIAGDTKTPHGEYIALEDEFPNVKYLHPLEQKQLYPELSEIVGWKTIERRNFAYLYAYKNGCDILASVDDDNIPYDFWGQDIKVGQDVEYDCYISKRSEYFDPLSITKDNHLWHRGYPIEHLQTRHEVEYKGKQIKKCLVQANLWDGDPDIDAMARLIYKPCVKYSEIISPYGSTQKSPFNSQNTFIAREAMPYFAMIPFVGRMDDIWASYILQHYFPNSVIYDKATVYQDRNVQDLVTNLEAEVIGYRNTLPLIEAKENFTNYFTKEMINFWETWQSYFPHISYK